MKSTGLGDDYFHAGFHIGGDIRDVAVNGGPGLIDVTDITQSAHSRLGGLRDGHFALTTYHDPAAGQAHAALSGLPTTDVIQTYLRGQAVGNPACCQNSKQVGYDPTRGNDGSLTIKFAGEANGFGQEWGEQLTAGLRTDTAATNGATQQDAAQTAFGAQAYLQATSFTGTDVTVTIQHSTTGSGGWSTLMSFTQITGGVPQAQRTTIANNTTVDQYVRAITTTVGGFTSFAFQVTFVRNLAAGQVF